MIRPPSTFELLTWTTAVRGGDHAGPLDLAPRQADPRVPTRTARREQGGHVGAGRADLGRPADLDAAGRHDRHAGQRRCVAGDRDVAGHVVDAGCRAAAADRPRAEVRRVPGQRRPPRTGQEVGEEPRHDSDDGQRRMRHRSGVDAGADVTGAAVRDRTVHVDLAAADVDVAVAPDVPADVDLRARQLEPVAAHGRGGGEDRVPVGRGRQRGDRRLRRGRGRWCGRRASTTWWSSDVVVVGGGRRRCRRRVVDVVVVGRRRGGRRAVVVVASWSWSWSSSRAGDLAGVGGARRAELAPRAVRGHRRAPVRHDRRCRPPDHAVRPRRRSAPAAGGQPSRSPDRPAPGGVERLISSALSLSGNVRAVAVVDGRRRR